MNRALSAAFTSARDAQHAAFRIDGTEEHQRIRRPRVQVRLEDRRQANASGVYALR
jgi:hypothetical protein